MLTQMVKHLETIYVSGWQSSSTASSTDEPSPDLADYPMVNMPRRSPVSVSRQMKLTQLGYCPQKGQLSFHGPALSRPQAAS